MKKRTRIAAAALLSTVMAVSTCAMTTAMTASAGTIKVNTAADSTNAYKAYQILKGTVTDEDTLSELAFGDNLTALTDKLVAALKSNTTIGTAFEDLTTTTSAVAFATMIGNLSTDAQRQAFARVIGKYVTGDGTTVTTDDTTVDDGYYIVKEEGSATPRTLNLLKVADAVVLDVKEAVPTSDKTVNDVNDSTGEPATGQKTADYDIGDDIPYTLTFTLPDDYANYEKYPVTFWDDMCAGLSLKTDSVMIRYGTGSATAIEFTAAEATEKNSANGGTVYKYVIGDLKTQQGASALAGGDIITITYLATLNENAAIGTPGNRNTYQVEYANDPNWTATPGPNETTPPTPPTDETPAESNVVFTYQLTVNKVDDDGNPLAGAGFTLYKWTDPANDSPSVDDTTGWTEVKVLPKGTATTFEFKGLDDGIYKLVESEKPDNYNQIAPKMFAIAADHNNDTLSLGTVNVTGLDTVSVTNGVISTKIENHKGVLLPSTGGIGTTIFYIVGGSLVAGAIVLLIVKKRMGSTEE